MATTVNTITTDFKKMIDEIGYVGSLLVGSAITLNDYGDSTVSWIPGLASMYVRPLNERELLLRPEGERHEGRSICYLSKDDELVAGSQYRVQVGSEEYDVVGFKKYRIGNSVGYQWLDLNRVNVD